MGDLLSQASWLRAGGYTRRYHGLRMIKEDLVSSHSYNVANIVLLIRPECSKELLVAAIRHDSAEWITGDAPGTTKRKVPGLKEAMDQHEREQFERVDIAEPTEGLTPAEYAVLKTADYLEGMMFCLQERQMGNTLLDRTFNVYDGWIRKFLVPEKSPENDLHEAILDEWLRSGGPLYVCE